ncbi:MAG: sulfatase-like hydrolase/transferase [Bacteroidota bacterium]|nr:sulfatase-like hydrolase/transferase [Bacteroidota bacterium]
MSLKFCGFIGKSFLLLSGLIAFIIIGCTEGGKDEAKEQPKDAGAKSPAVAAQNGSYQFGADILFIPAGNTAKQYQKSGWGNPAPGGTWTTSDSAKLTIPLAAMPGSQFVKLDAAITKGFLIPGKIKDQLLKIYINGTYVGDMLEDTDKPNDMRFPAVTFPSSLITEPQIDITFYLPRAAHPDNKGVKDQSVKLGVVLWSIKLTEANKK